MSSPTSTNRSNVIKLFIIGVFILVAIAGALLVYQRYNSKEAAPTTAEISGIAKKTPLEDRQAWLQLARAVLKAENVLSVSAPQEPFHNRGEANRVELGYQLFFDPILSGDQTIACASCHHPDHALADGLTKGIGAGGRELQRNTPSLFNVAFNRFLFWDGRAGSLEEQVISPLFSEEEMNQQSASELLRRLRAIPKYREMFTKAFGFNSKQDGSEISLPNIARAIAAFERKLNITDTAYDHFVKGRDDRLTTGQLRGMVVFFGQGQCAACHIPPQFHDDALASLGVPVSAEKGAPADTDPGFGAVIRRRDAFGVFKTTGLRNVSRTAPYMHNGIFKTLEEVIDFYNDGGGRGRGIEVISQDSKVVKLNLTDQQKKDLIGFLKSLESLEPPIIIPTNVPSGLRVGGR